MFANPVTLLCLRCRRNQVLFLSVCVCHVEGPLGNKRGGGRTMKDRGSCHLEMGRKIWSTEDGSIREKRTNL